MFLSHLRLNPLSREVHQSLGDVVVMHRMVMRGFGQVDVNEARFAHGVLHRVEVDHGAGRAQLLVQSASEPDWSTLPERFLVQDGEPPFLVRNIAASLDAIGRGATVRFRLRANPTRRVRPDAGNRDHSMRVELRGDDVRCAWLARHGERGGFHLAKRDGTPDVRIDEEPKLTGGQKHGSGSRRVVVAPVVFEGHLVVDDPDELRRTIARGIGAGKAYGMGLLSLPLV